MKKHLYIIVLLLIKTSLFAQTNTRLLYATEDSLTTNIFIEKKLVLTSNEFHTDIYRINDDTWSQKMLKSNYTSAGHMSNVNDATHDVELINGKPEDYILGNTSLSSGGSLGWMFGTVLYNKNGLLFQSWSKRWSNFSQKPNIEVSKQNPKLIYVSASYDFLEHTSTPDILKRYLLKSTDGGTNWNFLETNFTLVSVNKNDDGLLLGINDMKLVLKTNDTTLNCTIVDSAFTWDNNLTKFLYSADKKHIYTTNQKNGLNYIVMSEDNGYSWRGIVSDSNTIYISTDKMKPADIYYATGKKIYYSSNYGANFSLFNTATEVIVGIYKKPSAEYLYALCPNAIYSISKQATSVNPGTNKNIVTNYSLMQNYPNPFNPETTISFSIPSKSFVKLQIYDLLGREIATLVNEEFPAGTYSRPWNAAGLSGGVYFYRLQAGNYTETRKLNFLK